MEVSIIVTANWRIEKGRPRNKAIIPLYVLLYVQLMSERSIVHLKMYLNMPQQLQV